MSKVIGANRPIAIPWKEDPRPMPLTKPIDQSIPPSYDFAKNKDMRRPYRILALDGGGIRGILTIRLLMRISQHNPKFMDSIDFIAGTSVGGIISLLLSSGYSPKECDDIYGFAATHIFGHNPWRVINPWRSKYSDKAKEELFRVCNFPFLLIDSVNDTSSREHVCCPLIYTKTHAISINSSMYLSIS